HPRHPPKAAGEWQHSHHADEQETPARAAPHATGGAACLPSRVGGSLPREVGRAPPPPGRGCATQSIRPPGSQLARECPPDPATTHAPLAPYSPAPSLRAAASSEWTLPFRRSI